MLDREFLEWSVHHSTAKALIACDLVMPLPAQTQMLHECVAVAREQGLHIPSINIYWRDGHEQICGGAVAFYEESGRVEVHLDANRMPPELRQTIFHELQHVHDFASGETFTRVELEERALAFAAQMIERRQ